MLIKDTQWEKCKGCGRPDKLRRDAIYGCDNCKKIIDFNSPKTHWLETLVFNNDDETHRFQYCSWPCVINHLPKIKSNYFISLPYLNFDRTGKTSAYGFLRLLRAKK